MRCPKCGYISFDNVSECLKCKKDIKTVSSQLRGASFNVAAPAFLHFAENSPEAKGAPVDLFANDDDARPINIVDDDLNVLLENEPEVKIDDGRATVAEDRAVQAEESEDREIEIDLNQFESFAKKEESSAKVADDVEEREIEASGLSIELPEELADITDLAPPSIAQKSGGASMAARKDASTADLDFDNLDFDLGLVDESPVNAPAEQEPPTVLALDDIDFSDALGELPGRKDSNKSKGMDMDEDLDFDLDLGGLSIHKDL